MARKLPIAGQKPVVPNCPMRDGGLALPQKAPVGRIAVWQMGFRPFFLAGALYGVLLLPLWLLVLRGSVTLNPYFPGVFWHAHEMLFGFAMAIIGGFLLTSVGNWTQTITAVGRHLMGLLALWALGRVAVNLGTALPTSLVMLCDLAFIPALALTIARPLLAKKSVRNYGFLLLLTGAFTANLLFHLALTRGWSGWAERGQSLMLNVILLVLLIVAGRIIPLFTGNALEDETIQREPLLSHLALGAVSLLLVTEFALGAHAVTAVVALASALLVALRSRRWGLLKTGRDPLLLVLHVGHAWVVLGLALKGASMLTTAIPKACGTHALTIGAIATLILGMIVRVALGHTGRPRVASTWSTLAFGLITASALSRVVTPVAWPAGYLTSLWVSGLLWTAAFVIYLATFTPILLLPRADGKAG